MNAPTVHHRKSDAIAMLLLGVTFGAMFGIGLTVLRPDLFAQSLTQDAINAVTTEKFADFGRRLNDVESALRWAMGALLMNLSAHIVQIYGQVGRRRSAKS